MKTLEDFKQRIKEELNTLKQKGLYTKEDTFELFLQWEVEKDIYKFTAKPSRYTVCIIISDDVETQFSIDHDLLTILDKEGIFYFMDVCWYDPDILEYQIVIDLDDL